MRKRGGASSAHQGDSDASLLTKQSVQALYDYTASSDVPFLPDPRMELSMKRGDAFQLIHKREEDGWCLVCTSTGADEGWVCCRDVALPACQHVLWSCCSSPLAEIVMLLQKVPSKFITDLISKPSPLPTPNLNRIPKPKPDIAMLLQKVPGNFISTDGKRPLVDTNKR